MRSGIGRFVFIRYARVIYKAVVVRRTPHRRVPPLRIRYLPFRYVRVFVKGVLFRRTPIWWLPPLAFAASCLFGVIASFEEHEYDGIPFLVIAAIAPLIARYIGTTGDKKE